MDITIRKVKVTDAKGFRSALGSVAEEKKYILTVAAPSLESVTDFISNNVRNNYAQYVAVAKGQVVGWADIIPFQKVTLSHVGGLGMGVLEEYRGRGVGTRLLSSVTDHAWSSGLKRLELEVFANNEPAISLYKKHGYEIEGLKKYACYIDDTYQDIVVMAQHRV